VPFSASIADVPIERVEHIDVEYRSGHDYRTRSVTTWGFIV